MSRIKHLTAVCLIISISTVVLAIMLIGLGGRPILAQAGVRYVAPGGSCGGVSPCYASVQAAVDAAGSGDEILIATGIYTGVNIRPRSDLTTTGVVTQVVYVSKTIILRGGYATTDWTTPHPLTQPTTLDAQGLGRVLYVTGQISPVIEGLHIVNGAINTEQGGGGIFIYAAQATIARNHILSNTAKATGGVAVYSSNSVLDGNTIAANTSHCGGGGIVLWYSPATVVGNTIISNTAGAGSCVSDPDGGGLYLFNSDAAIVDNNLIAYNTTPADGGGLFVLDSDASISRNTIRDNTSKGNGGGINVLYDSHAELDGNLFVHNTAHYGGGVFIQSHTLVTLTNNVIADNSVASSGSGLYSSDSSPRLLHTTIARNSGGDESGIHMTGLPVNQGTIVLTNTILVSQTIGLTITTGSTATLAGVLWYNNSLNYSGTGAISLTAALTGNPAFAADGYHLTESSAARDVGVPTSVLIDIDGQPRPHDDDYDMGADEFVRLYPIFLPLIMLNQ